MKRFADYAIWLAIFLCGCLLVVMLAYPALATSICLERADIYEVALADSQGNALAAWKQKVDGGLCANLSGAHYYRTLSTFTDGEGQLIRIVEFHLYGSVVYGVLKDLPEGVHLIARREQ